MNAKLISNVLTPEMVEALARQCRNIRELGRKVVEIDGFLYRVIFNSKEEMK